MAHTRTTFKPGRTIKPVKSSDFFFKLTNLLNCWRETEMFLPQRQNKIWFNVVNGCGVDIYPEKVMGNKWYSIDLCFLEYIENTVDGYFPICVRFLARQIVLEEEDGG